MIDRRNGRSFSPARTDQLGFCRTPRLATGSSGHQKNVKYHSRLPKRFVDRGCSHANCQQRFIVLIHQYCFWFERANFPPPCGAFDDSAKRRLIRPPVQTVQQTTLYFAGSAIAQGSGNLPSFTRREGAEVRGLDYYARVPSTSHAGGVCRIFLLIR